MPDSFAEYIRRQLEDLDKGPSTVIEDDYDAENFGNARAICRLGQLTLHFLNDRGLVFIDVELPDAYGGNALVPLENLAVAANLRDLEDLLRHYGLSRAVADASVDDDPPTGPFLTFEGALELLDKHWDMVVRSCTDKEVLRSVSEIQETIHEHSSQSLSAAPGGKPPEPEAELTP